MQEIRQVGIVTGGASGIGKAIGKELIKRGVHVVIADMNTEQGHITAAELRQLGGESTFAKVDVTDAAQVEELVYGVYGEFGRLDYMFNNAGIAMYGELCDMTEQNWKRIIDVNVWGVIYGVQAAYPLMKEQGFGKIANTASAAGLGPAPTTAAYSATKHAVVGLTTSLHYEAEAYGVSVSCLCPAFVDTPIFDSGEAIQMDKSKVIAQVRKQKLMTPEHFAALAIRGLDKNDVLVNPMPLRRTMDIMFTLCPGLHRKVMQFVCKTAREAKLDPR
ncbi:Diacetyl reductase [(S)-acetoin forming] [Paenibacillus auburnensis]|uniref:Diacetyl reductase [(S)-acetoin forming] n=1 Tax=Paenibacillus auburnensis TaxID=2905649 RepID=A0ABN8G5G0_9BACL|nr:SDR family oxidoreductase [Paenibacillus auburnensis]CAH1196559.1 Diacetyl reductase [(S)-acetoin forming] [Paenibacillus auburnensis]